VVNGLWTTDPLNPQTRRDLASGLSFSVLHLPQRPSRPNPASGLPEGLRFSFRGPPGEVVTVAGCFNNWDPFMFELREGPAGYYSLLIPLPPGTYQYLFFHRGQRLTDPYNPNRIFARDGRAASVIVVP
jgi:1,4-alpha-glucan branching enzyme